MPAKKQFRTAIVRAEAIDELERLRVEIQVETGLPIKTPALLEHVVYEGIAAIRQRPALAIDCAPRADDRASSQLKRGEK